MELDPECHVLLLSFAGPHPTSFSSIFSAAIETMQGMEETTVKAGPTVSQQGRPVDLYSYQWKGMKEKFLKGQPKVLGVSQLQIGEDNDGIVNSCLINIMLTTLL